jgi:photosystem II stability/assembly factor-like uncharacterized protein
MIGLRSGWKLAVVTALSAAGLAFAASPARARPQSPPPHWTRIGPSTALVNALAVTAGPGSVLAATADAGVFRSDDGAASWIASNAGLAGFEVQDVAADPADPATAYAATEAGLSKSSDGGRTWALTALAGRVRRVAVAPSSHQRLYAVLQTLPEGVEQLWRSDDGGITWHEADGGLVRPFFDFALAADPTRPDRAYAVLDFTLYETLDAGRHWTDQVAALPAGGIEVFAIDPRHPNTLYLGGNGGLGKPAGFFRSLDGGHTWALLRLPVPIVLPRVLAVSTSGRLYAGGNYFPRGQLTFNLYSSDNGGATWTAEAVPQDVPAALPKDVHAIAIDPARPARAFAASGLGVLKRLSRWPAWLSAQSGLRATAITTVGADPHTAGTLYVEAHVGGSDTRTELGAFESRDRGATWQPAAPVLTVGTNISTVFSFDFDPNRPQVVYAAGGGLFRTLDSGGHWSMLPAPRILLASTAVAPGSSKVVFAAGWSTTSCSGLGCPDFPPQLAVLESVDGGATWSDVSSRLMEPGAQGQFHAVRIDPAHPWLVYLAGSRTFGSRDGGATFHELPVGSPLTDLVLDPAFPRTLYAATAETPGRVLKSVDAGAAWTPADAGLPTDPAFETLRLAIDPATRALYVGTTRGVYVSRDQGATWQRLAGLPGGIVFGLAADPFHPGVVYAGTEEPGGLFVYAP